MISLIFGIPLLLVNNNFGYLFVAISVHYSIKFYEFYKYYVENKKSYFLSVEDELKTHIDNEYQIWNFEEDYFQYKSDLFNAKISWEMFVDYYTLNDFIFMNLHKENLNQSYVLSKDELSSESYHEVLRFLENKLHKKPN